MAFDAFLKLVTSTGTPVAGESVDATHKGEIQLLGYNLGVSHPVTQGSATGGAGAGKASFSDFSFTSAHSKASPLLIQACAAGTRFNTATVSVRKAGAAQAKGGGFEFLKITMSTVFVSSLSTGGAGSDESPHDQVTLSYGKIQIQYSPQSPTGVAEPPVTAGWDVVKNGPA